MPDKKLKDNEIIKALEECIELRFDDTEYATVRLDTLTNALDLINHQKEEIERLKENIDGLNIFTTNHIKVVRLQSIKEFAERLKEKSDSRFDYSELVFEISEGDINNLLKEMVGDDNA